MCIFFGCVTKVAIIAKVLQHCDLDHDFLYSSYCNFDYETHLAEIKALKKWII